MIICHSRLEGEHRQVHSRTRPHQSKSLLDEGFRERRSLKYCQEAQEGVSSKDPQVVTLPKHSQGRPLLLGQELSKSVQIFIDLLRKTGGIIVNSAIVVGAVLLMV